MRKRYRLHLQGREHLDRWLVSYADYMTLIFALFVVLYSVAIVNKEEYRAVIEGMTQAFNQAPRSDGLLEGRGNSLLDRARPLRPPRVPPSRVRPSRKMARLLRRSTCRSRSPWAPWSMRGW